MSRAPMSEPVAAPADLAPYVEGLLQQLRERRLEVELIPSLDDDCAMRGGRIRVAVDRNAPWYRDFCERPPRTSRVRGKELPDTKISRRRTEEALLRLLGAGTRSSYAEELLAYAAELRDEELGGWQVAV